jgi:uncharacterized protein (DUF302 family)
MSEQKEYAFRAKLGVSYEETLERVQAALKEEGFGVLTNIDMKATLREKLNANFRKYAILGVCNPPLAQRALAEELDAGLVLPCSVVIYESNGGSIVSIVNPAVAVELLENPELRPIAEEAQLKLERVMATLKG